jgi:protein-disulfide isomerase/uncharacterized membrane protein
LIYIYKITKKQGLLLTKVKLAILATLVSMAFHFYLSWTYYPLKFAQSDGNLICNINATFNCDAVAASNFSSFLNVPLAVWGLSTNFIFLILLLIYAFRLTDYPEKTFRKINYLALFIAGSSIIMGLISLIYLSVFCLFCIGAYITSLLSLALVWDKSSFKASTVLDELKGLISENKSFLVLILCIPILSFLINSSLVNQYGAGNLNQVINSSLFDWTQNEKQTLDAEPSLALGPDRQNATMIISEFADFLCGHCKHAAPSLHAFSRGHQGVRFEFYSFALDGECNEVVPQAVGAPCFLAKAVYCGNKQNFGWNLHDIIFENQNEFYSNTSASKAEETLRALVDINKLNWDELKSCIDSDEALASIKTQGKTGDASGVKGTPTIFVNGKKLPRGQLLPVLEAVYKTL